MQYSNHKRVTDLMNNEMKEQFAKFKDQIIDNKGKLVNNIKQEMKHQLFLQAKNFASDENVKFDIVVDIEIVKVIPKNFFTGLLIEGVFCPSALFGTTELVTKKGRYIWKDDTFYVIPIDSIVIGVNF